MMLFEGNNRHLYIAYYHEYGHCVEVEMFLFTQWIRSGLYCGYESMTKLRALLKYRSRLGVIVFHDDGVA